VFAAPRKSKRQLTVYVVTVRSRPHIRRALVRFASKKHKKRFHQRRAAARNERVTGALCLQQCSAV